MAECAEVLESIQEADLSRARCVYFGWMEPDGTMHTSSFGESQMETAGMLEMHKTAIIGNTLGLVSITNGEGDDDDDDDVDA